MEMMCAIPHSTYAQTHANSIELYLEAIVVIRTLDNLAGIIPVILTLLLYHR